MHSIANSEENEESYCAFSRFSKSERVRVGINDPVTLLNQSITSTIMWSFPSRRLLLFRLTSTIKVLHSLLLSENTQIEILSRINRRPIDGKIRSRVFLSIPLRPPDFSLPFSIITQLSKIHDSGLAHATKRKASHPTFRTEVEFLFPVVTLVDTQFTIWIKWRKEYEVVSRICGMNVEHAHFVARAAVAAVDFLLGWLWWIRRREWMWKCEEDDVLCQSTVTGSVACLSFWRCLCHLVE